MRSLDRKLLRELWRMRGQMVSITLVIACGILTVVAMRGVYESLRDSRELYYRQSRFADVWSSLKRAPDRLRERIEKIPGVAAVQTRVELEATLDVPGRSAPARGHVVSVPDRGEAALNVVHLLRGRPLSPGRASEVLVSEAFAGANGLEPGDTLRAVINGHLQALEIAGIALSPEYVYELPPGAIFPDNERFGVLWMRRGTIGPLYDMDGAFNSVALSLAPDASERAVITRLDRLLAPYGGLGAYGRDQQVSHLTLEGELQQDRTTSTVIPAIFLGVAAFLVNMVLTRLIALERGEIAVLKAFGYTDREVARHYLGFALAAALAGALLGTGLGIWFGHGMVRLYQDFFRFPDLRFHGSPGLILASVAVSTAAATLGAFGAVHRAVRLPPAEGMRPEPPARFRPGPLERAGFGRFLPASGRMILRNVERRPVRALLSAVAVACAVALLMVGMFMFDGVAFLMHLQFDVIQREDFTVTFVRPVPAAARLELERLPGVIRAEGFRALPARLRAGPRSRTVSITGMEVGMQMRRLVSTSGREQPLPPEGLVLSRSLAERLAVGSGDRVRVEVLEGARPTRTLRVAGVVDELMGLSAYMEEGALHRLAGEGRVLSGAYLRVDPSHRAELGAVLKRLPVISGISSPGSMLAAFQKQLKESLLITVGFLVVFAGVIAMGIVYNGARIALSERGRELASLRVLGFTRREVATMLLGEQSLVTLLAIPLGWGLGYLLAALLATALETESYRIPLVVGARTYAWSALIVVAAAAISGMLVRRRMDRLDLVEVLKTRE
jgi:putative ABC transport system permease protein